ncbi:Pentatricopeptide repeat superfamily protein isoform 2 [Hibiscus syriacus]|uniref:Pentatricopeptide repeat superfamily protein isoform 2 n=1 Tax=Hibiscus syriacus TaxID=106335 RepID=A0A6A2X838_HIBSY|nr:Pentatricopeptide repeat superfamily protein isoform 2 [Hibiscus syriacus]
MSRLNINDVKCEAFASRVSDVELNRIKESLGFKENESLDEQEVDLRWEIAVDLVDFLEVILDGRDVSAIDIRVGWEQICSLKSEDGFDLKGLSSWLPQGNMGRGIESYGRYFIIRRSLTEAVLNLTWVRSHVTKGMLKAFEAPAEIRGQAMVKAKGSSSLVSRPIIIPWETHFQQSFTEKLLSLLQKCTSTKLLRQIHTQMLINAIQKPNFLLSKVIDLKNFTYASLLFSQIPQPNDYAFNVMIRGLTITWKNYSATLHFYYQMKFLALRPNKFTYPFLFISCAILLELSHGQLAHSSIFKLGLDIDPHTTHSLITMYARCGELGDARKVFDEITERDLVSWNSMISGYSKMGHARDAVGLFVKMREDGFIADEMTLVSVLGACGDLGDLSLGMWVEGYAQNGLSNEAIKLFHVMKDAGVNPDKITLVGVLSACALIGAIDLGKWIDTYASQRGLQHNVFVSTALVDMHAKCGSLYDAQREALSLFERMSTEGMDARPNDMTFVGVLSGCVHAGLVDEGWRYFNLMSFSYGLTPKIEHYSCMVDLLARAGQLYEAWDFIEKMPEKPDEIVLGALLGTCQKCKNLNVSEKVMRFLLQMEPSNSGNYVLIKDICKLKKVG